MTLDDVPPAAFETHDAHHSDTECDSGNDTNGRWELVTDGEKTAAPAEPRQRRSANGSTDHQESQCPHDGRSSSDDEGREQNDRRARRQPPPEPPARETRDNRDDRRRNRLEIHRSSWPMIRRSALSSRFVSAPTK